jgi:hypothetical protein
VVLRGQTTKKLVETNQRLTTLSGLTPKVPLSYPIREDFLAQLIVPRDITMDEARRLGAFIATLAKDFKPA